MFSTEEESSSVLGSVFYVFENYGWHLLILSICLILVYHKVLKDYINKYKQYRFEQEYSAKYHKNPDVFAAHVNAQQAWAEKMQEKYNKESVEYQKKMQEKEERKKQEFIEKYGTADGYKLGNGKTDDSNQDSSKQNKNLRPGYNPLMGSGGSSGYRPPRRSPCGGGGCGR